MSRRDEAVAWRVSVLELMLKALALVGSGIVVVVYVLREKPQFDAAFLLLVSLFVALITLRFARVIPFRLRAGLSIAVLLLGCLVLTALTGFALGVGAGIVSSIVIAVMLLGRRVALTLLVATAIALALLGVAAHEGWHHPRLSDTDPRLLVNWLRMAVSLALVTGALAFAVDFVVRHVETKYAELSAAYDELGELHRKLETAKEEERRFVARELHDDLGQALTVLKLALKTGKSTPFSDPLRVVDGLIVKVRELSRALRPALLDEVGLAPALGAHLEEQSTVSGVAMELDARGFDERLPGELEIACFRLVQEAVTNTLRHAGAKHVKVRIERRADAVRLRVEDDGNGSANPETLVRAGLDGHLGVVGMRERARALGGTFRIHSEPEKGTTLEVELPLRS